MALIVQHFKQNKVPKVYICSDQQMYIAKGKDLYADAIDFEGEEVYYTETDIPLFPPEPDEPATDEDYESALERLGVTTNDEN